MFVFIVVYFRQLSVMNSDLVNRSSQHNYTSDSSEVNNHLILATRASQEFSPETMANNPMYVVSPGNQDKNINISRKKKIPRRETGHVYQEPSDSLNTLPLSVVLRSAPVPPRKIK